MSEREITDAEGWELRCRQAEGESLRLQKKIFDLQEQVMRLSREVLERRQAEQIRENQELFSRVGMRPGDELVERDGRYVVVPEAEKSEAEASSAARMDLPGGAPAADESPEEGAGE